jgi:hypothetical protein
MALNIFGDAPQSLTGLLGEQATEDLRKKALTTGLINAAIGYIAQPKTGGYGSALPYIGRALMAGQQGAQGVYEGAITDFERQQKIDEFKRKQEQRKAFEAAVPNLMRTTPAQFESVTTPGGYAPQQTEVMPGQVSPNFGMTRLPDVTTQREIAPARTEFDNQALMNLAIQFPEQAAPIISSMKGIKELTAAPKRNTATIGNNLVDVDTQEVLYTAPKDSKLEKFTDKRIEYTYEVDGNGKRTLLGVSPIDAPKAPEKIGYKVETDAKTGNIVYVPDRPGSPVLDVSGKPTTYTPAGKEKPATDAQNLASGFYDRMTSSSAIINAPAIGEDGNPILDPKTKKPLTLEEVAGRPEKFAQLYRNIPGLSTLGNVVESPLRQQYRQAQENWVRANLRKESGAVIGEEEMKSEIATYFPQIGDDDKTIKQKAESRKVTENAMRKNAGLAVSSTQENVAKKPKSKVFTLDDGTKVGATLGADGNYYVTKGNKKFKVEE